MTKEDYCVPVENRTIILLSFGLFDRPHFDLIERPPFHIMVISWQLTLVHILWGGTNKSDLIVMTRPLGPSAAGECNRKPLESVVTTPQNQLNNFKCINSINNRRQEATGWTGREAESSQ